MLTIALISNEINDATLSSDTQWNVWGYYCPNESNEEIMSPVINSSTDQAQKSSIKEITDSLDITQTERLVVPSTSVFSTPKVSSIKKSASELSMSSNVKKVVSMNKSLLTGSKKSSVSTILNEDTPTGIALTQSERNNKSDADNMVKMRLLNSHDDAEGINRLVYNCSSSDLLNSDRVSSMSLANQTTITIPKQNNKRPRSQNITKPTELNPNISSNKHLTLPPEFLDSKTSNEENPIASKASTSQLLTGPSIIKRKKISSEVIVS